MGRGSAVPVKREDSHERKRYLFLNPPKVLLLTVLIQRYLYCCALQVTRRRNHLHFVINLVSKYLLPNLISEFVGFSDVWVLSTWLEIGKRVFEEGRSTEEVSPYVQLPLK